jgi:hypothetical protein
MEATRYLGHDGGQVWVQLTWPMTLKRGAGSRRPPMSEYSSEIILKRDIFFFAKMNLN